MEKVILKSEVRSATGKKAAKDLRAKGVIPANVYKSGKAALSLQVGSRDLDDVLTTGAGANVIITLKITGGDTVKDKTVLIKEIQRDPVKERILHVDFNEISLTELLKVDVPLAAHGEPVGVKVDGGVLDHVMWQLHVECLPTDIPEKIEVDVSGMKIGDSILVKDIKVPAGVKVLNDPELITMIVKPPKVEVPAEAVTEEAAAAEPELIRKKKEEGVEGEDGEKAAAEPKAKEAPKEASKEAKK